MSSILKWFHDLKKRKNKLIPEIIISNLLIDLKVFFKAFKWMQRHLASFELLSNLARNFILIVSMLLFSSSKNEEINLNLNINLLNKCKFKFKFVKYCPNSFDELNSSSHSSKIHQESDSTNVPKDTWMLIWCEYIYRLFCLSRYARILKLSKKLFLIKYELFFLQIKSQKDFKINFIF